MKKILIGVVAVVVLVPAIAFAYLKTMKPAQRPASSEKVESTPERIARGKYMVETVVGCIECHSDFDLEKYTFPPKPGSEYAGGFCFDKDVAGFPGKVCAQNITSDNATGIGTWTDGEILRAVREGVSRDGDALFPMMPYPYFKIMSDEDAKSVVAYLRTLPPTNKQTEVGYIDFPVNLFIKFEPKPLDGPVPEPDRKDTVAYGKYLATLSCIDCHTPVDSTMHPIPGKEFSGGRMFDISSLVPGMKFASANLTPDDETGIGQRSRENFIALFKAFSDPEYRGLTVPGESNTLMPWVRFSQLTEEDLGAIYDYLRTVPAVKNAVDRRPPPKIAKTEATPAAPATPAK